MKIVMPVAGASSRFPGMKPKWLLTHPDGNLMFFKALEGLDLQNVEELVVVCRQDHQDELSVDEIIARQFGGGRLPVPHRVVLVPRTRSQPETVACAIEQGGLEGPIFIKDSDNKFQSGVRPGNLVATMDLNRLSYIDAANKSYVELDQEGRVTNIVEKRVISNTFCVGGYGFASGTEFLATFRELENSPALYVSHVIYKMLMDGHIFESLPVDGFIDWGTLRDWDRYKRQFGAIFLDLDGTIVRSSAQFFAPYWGTTDAIAENLTAVNALYDTGKVRIVVTTSRTRAWEAATREQLKRIGLKYHDIIFEIPHAQRILVNDYSRTNPYPSAEAVNLPRDGTLLDQMLAAVFRE